jgi:hypothetical protein
MLKVGGIRLEVSLKPQTSNAALWLHSYYRLFYTVCVTLNVHRHRQRGYMAWQHLHVNIKGCHCSTITLGTDTCFID